jgi:hypothetical protein
MAGALDETIARMEAIGRALPAGDGVGYFNFLYLEVTRELSRRLGGGGFDDPGFAERLTVVFAGAYFRAVDSPPGGGSRAWRPLFEARRNRRIAPVQFALAGVNAHINYDLPIAVVDTCAALGRAPRDGGPEHRDYLRVNAILAEVQERVKPRLLPGGLGVLDRAFGNLDDVVAMFSVERARDAAWLHAKSLWRLRDEPELTAAYRETLERSVGLAGRGLLVPTLLGLSGWAAQRERMPAPVKRLLGAPRV